MSNQAKTLNQSPTVPWFIWSTIAVFYCFQFLISVSPSVIADDLMQDLGIKACALGELASYYYIGYTSMQLPVGIIIDRVGIRLPVTIAVLLCSLGCYIFSVSDSITFLSFGRLLMGVGSAFAFLSCVKSASLWFRPQQLGLMVGLTLLLGTFGAASGGPGISAMLDFMPWKQAFIFLLSAGVALSIICWLVIKDRDANPYVTQEEDTSSFSIIDSLIYILKKPQTYIFGLYGGFMYVPLSGFADMWGTPYLMEAFQTNKATATSAVSMMYLGIGLGSPLSAWISDYITSHKRVMFWSALASALLFATCLYAALPFSIMYILYFTLGAFLGTQFLAFASVCQINPIQMSGTASAVQNMINMTSGIIFQPVIGKLLELVWEGGSKANGVPLYTLENYKYALGVVPLCLAGAVFLSFFMKETYPRD